MRGGRLLSSVALVALVTLMGLGVPASAQAPTLRIVAYNIRHGRGMDDEVDLARVADVLRALDADVITLQEVDRETDRTGRVDQAAVLAELLGYRGFHGAHRPYQGGEYGNAVLTRLPVRASRTYAIPPASGSALAVHEVEVDVEGFGPVSVVSVHLSGSPEERLAQADSVTSFFVEVGRPVVLAGDFDGGAGRSVRGPGASGCRRGAGVRSSADPGGAEGKGGPLTR